MSKFKLNQTEDGKVSSIVALMGEMELMIAEFDPAVDIDKALGMAYIKKEDLAGYEPPPQSEAFQAPSQNHSKARGIMLSKALRVFPSYDQNLKCNFGKYKGKPAKDIPKDYKQWIITEVLEGRFELNSFITFCFVVNCFHALDLNPAKLGE